MPDENETANDSQEQSSGAEVATQAVETPAKDSTPASETKSNAAARKQESASRQPVEDAEADEAEELSPAELKKQLERTKRDLERANKEAAKSRTERKGDRDALEELRKGLAKALGLAEEESADPKKLQTELAELKGKYQTERLKGAFAKAAKAAGVDEEISYALMSLNGELADLDVEDKSLAAEIQLRLEELKDKNPRVRLEASTPAPKTEEKAKRKAEAPQVPDASSAEMKTNAEPALTAEMIRNMTPDQINDPKNWDRIAAALANNTLK